MKSNFISVLSSPLSNVSTLVLRFTANSVAAATFPGGDPMLTPGTFDVTVNNLLTSDTPADVAAKIYAAFAAVINASGGLYAYTGQMVFPMSPAPFTFRAFIIDHIVSIWSQSQFTVKKVSDTSQCYISYGNTPTFPMLAEAKEIAAVNGINLVDMNNVAFSDTDIKIAMELSSAQICAWLRGFNVVLSTYGHQETGEWARGFTVRFNPVVFNDHIVVRGPSISDYTGSEGPSVVQRFNVDSYTGVVDFLDWSNAVQVREIGDFGNSILMTYAAGYSSVPDAVKAASVRVLGMTKEPLSIAEFRGGSGGMKFRDKDKVMAEILYSLQEFSV